MKALILAAGLSKRFKPLSYIIPKPLFRLGDKLLIDYIIEWLIQNKITEIIIITNKSSRLIEAYLGLLLKEYKNVNIDILYTKPLGTAGQLKVAESLINSTFLILYCDVIFNFSLENIITYHIQKKSIFTIGVIEQKIPIRYGVITHTKDGIVKRWDEKPSILVKVNTGIYVAEPKIFNFIEDNKILHMNELVERLIKSKENVYAYTIEGNYYDIGTFKDYVKILKNFDKELGEI